MNEPLQTETWLTAIALGETTDPPRPLSEDDHDHIRVIRRTAEWARAALATEPLPESPDMYERIRNARNRDRRRARAMVLLPAGALAAAIAVGAAALWVSDAPEPADPGPVTVDPEPRPEPGVVVIGEDSGQKLAELPLELPNPVFSGTPKDIPTGVNIDMKRFGKPRTKVMAPAGITNVAVGKKVTSSDDFPIIGDLEMVTDGDKEALDGRFVELAPGKQWVQIDLGEAHDISVIVLWHNHLDPRVYRDVIVQVSNDPEFKQGVTTVFNNDADASSKMGKGDHFEYFENYEGEVIGIDPAVRARYVRCYTNGSTADDANHYSEVEVWAK